MGIGILLTVIGPFQGVRYFSLEARESLAAISLSLLCMFIAARAVFLMTSGPAEQTSQKRRWLPGPATRVVMAAALAGGLMLTVFSSYLPAVPRTWQHQGGVSVAADHVVERAPAACVPGSSRRWFEDARQSGFEVAGPAVSRVVARRNSRGLSRIVEHPGTGGTCLAVPVCERERRDVVDRGALRH